MFAHHNAHTYTWTSANGKTHNHIDRILVDEQRHSSIFDAQPFRAADCDTDHYLVVAKVRERLAVNKQDVTYFIWGGLFSKNHVEISNRFAALQGVYSSERQLTFWRSIQPPSSGCKSKQIKTPG
jgi:hypothetical protein